MVYMCGDRNWLDVGCRKSINEMEEIGSDANVSVLVLFDPTDIEDPPPPNPPPQPPRNDSGPPVVCYNITKDNDTQSITSQELYTQAEMNMSDPINLVNFVEMALTNFTALHYALVLDDHGFGWQGIINDGKLTVDQPPDDWSTQDTMSIAELRWALDKIRNDTGVTVDILGFDACRMAQTEVYYYVRDLAGICVASEDYIWAEACFAFDYILGNLTSNPQMTSEDLADCMVTTYRDWFIEHNFSQYYDNATMSSIDLTGMTDLARSIDDLADHLRSNMSALRDDINYSRQNAQVYGYPVADFVDICNFAELLGDRTTDTVLMRLCQEVCDNISRLILSEWHGPDSSGSHGITVYFPGQWSEYVSDYGNISMSVDLNWDDFLAQYLG
jgi:hypothetical protein